MEVEIVQLPQQVWVARNGDAAPSEQLLKPIANHSMKPEGGIWTSTFNEETVCNWHQWCLADGAEDWVDGKLIYALEPVPARIYTIDGRADLIQLARKYGTEYMPHVRKLDFETMVQDGIEAIHLTEDGQWRTRCGDFPYNPGGWNLYGWDCESTIWFKWCFEKVESLGIWRKAEVVK